MNIGNPSAIAREFMEHGHCDACPIIDMHGHWGPYVRGYHPAAPPEKMIRVLRRAGVQRIICSSHEAIFGDPVRGNAEMQKAIETYPDILSGYWAVNPNYPELARRAGEDFQKTRGFVGFKFLSDYHLYPVTGDRYRSALEYADEQQLLVLVHTWGGSKFDSPQLLEAVAAK